MTASHAIVQATIAFPVSALIASLSLARRFENLRGGWRSKPGRYLSITIVLVSSLGSTVAATLIPLIADLAPDAFLGVVLMPGGLAVKSRRGRTGADDTAPGRESEGLTQILTVGISYLLQRLQEQIYKDAAEWAMEKVLDWQEDGLLGALDFYYHQLHIRFSVDMGKMGKIEAVRHEVEGAVSRATRTRDRREQERALGRARSNLLILLRHAYIWGAWDLPAYLSKTRIVIGDANVQYEVSYSFDTEGDERVGGLGDSDSGGISTRLIQIALNLEQHRMLDRDDTTDGARQRYRRKLLSEELARLAGDVNLDLGTGKSPEEEG